MFQNTGMYGQQLPSTGGYGAAPYGYQPPPSYGYGDKMPPIHQEAGWRPFLRFSRRRINLVPIVACVLVPWLLFATVFFALSSQAHYKQPALSYFVVACCAVVVIVAGAVAALTRVKRFSSPERDPSWTLPFFLSMFLALAVGFILGTSNYSTHMAPYMDIRNLNSYMDVYPTRVRGQQLMDAGIVSFARGSRLDLNKSMGFRSKITYCVAPITLGDEPLATYDFWSVGTECCSAAKADFHCSGFNNPNSNGGLRLMDDSKRAYYRLAVQQAEAAYHIRANHPLFFEWVEDPMGRVEDWQKTGRSNCIAWIAAYFVFQLFSVAAVTLAFSRLGSLS